MGADETQGDGDGVAVYRPPGRPGLSFFKVQVAADELLREGSRPTVEKIRAKVGGSPNTIIEHLDKWWASLAKRIEFGSEAFSRLPRSYAHLAESFFHQSMEEFRKVASVELSLQRGENAAKADAVNQRALVLDEREKELAEAIADRDLRIAELETALIERSSQLLTERTEKQALLRRFGRLTSEVRRTHQRLLIGALSNSPSKPKAAQPVRTRAAIEKSAHASKSRNSPRKRHHKQKSNRRSVK